MSKRICFPTYEDWEVAFKSLDAESCKELILAVFDYGLRREIKELSPMAQFAMNMIKPLMDRDWEKYEKLVIRNKTNSKNAGRPKKSSGIEKNPVDLFGIESNPVGATETQSESIINNNIINSKILNNIQPKGYEKIDFSFVEVPFKDIFFRWLTYKKNKNQKYKDEDSLKTLYKKLKEYSSNDPDIAKDVIEQSISNNWAGLFPLKEQSTGINTGKIQKEGFGWKV